MFGEFGAVQKCVNVVALRKSCKKYWIIRQYNLVAKIGFGFDTAENEPSKVWYIGLTFYLYLAWIHFAAQPFSRIGCVLVFCMSTCMSVSSIHCLLGSAWLRLCCLTLSISSVIWTNSAALLHGAEVEFLGFRIRGARMMHVATAAAESSSVLWPRSQRSWMVEPTWGHPCRWRPRVGHLPFILDGPPENGHGTDYRPIFSVFEHVSQTTLSRSHMLR